jgi:hypothetical protein
VTRVPFIMVAFAAIVAFIIGAGGMAWLHRARPSPPPPAHVEGTIASPSWPHKPRTDRVRAAP